jgi:hypothetical protein
LFQIFFVSAVLASVDIDPDVPHDVDKLGSGTRYLAQVSVIILKF